MRDYNEGEAAASTAEVASGDNRAAGIARGRMASALVHVIKFSQEGSDSELAAKFATTPGKINDIKKDRNFKYVTKELGFTADEIKDAKDRFHASVFAENSTVAADKRDEIVAAAHTALDGLTAVAESQLTTARASDRKPRGKKKEGGDAEVSEAGEEGGEEESEEELEDLLENE